MKYRVEVTGTAAADIEEAYDYYLKHAPDHAELWLDGVMEAIQSLREMPQRCGPALESRYLKTEIRQLLYQSHRILFSIDGNLVHVLHVRHHARRPLKRRRGNPPA